MPKRDPPTKKPRREQGLDAVQQFTAFLESLSAVEIRRGLVQAFAEKQPDPDLAARVRLLPNLLDELAEKGLGESDVVPWLARGLELYEYLMGDGRDDPGALRVMRRPPRLAAVPELLAQRRDRYARMTRPPATIAESDERAVFSWATTLYRERVVIPLQDLDRTILKSVRDAFRYVRPQETAARATAQRLTAAMQEKLGRPHVGLVAALLVNVGLVNTGCWRQMPTAGERERARAWCRRLYKGARACNHGRCEGATAKVKALLKGVKPT